MSTVDTPADSAEYISKLAKHVKIKESGIEKLGKVLVEEINSDRLTCDNFSQHDVHPKAHDPYALDWIFVVDTLNFCFWHFEGSPGWKVEGKTGYFALCMAVNRAMRENVDILNPKFYSNLNEDQLFQIFRGDDDVQIPLPKDRLRCLHEAGSILLKDFEGTFKNVVQRANNCAVTLLSLIVDSFPCFRDECEYKERKVSFYKRAQILVGDIWACFKNEGLGRFENIDKISMFADYRVPQSLVYFGVLEYSDHLNDILNLDLVLKAGDEYEVEIRGCSIHAVTLLTEYVKTRLNPGKTINAILVDHFLWDFRRSKAKEIVEMKIPFHKTYNIYY